MSGLYSIQTFQSLSINLDRDMYKLNDESIEKIIMLKKLLNIKENNFVKPINIPFKVTEIKKSEDGIDKIINEIRIMLNKISDNTLNKYTNEIIEKIKSIQNTISSDEFSKISETIFNIACTNHFYVHLYAILYKSLIDNFAFFTHIFNKSLEGYLELFNTIETVDPIKDYNKFCEITKKNDRRKATSTFYIHLMKQGVLDINVIENLILELQSKLIKNKSDKFKLEENIELCENIFVFISNGKEELIKETKWNAIIDNIKNISSASVSTNEGLSNKIIFKHMDILDMITT
tara:strand:- start:18714 stop:19586 length:873 start_codon:yes stop_codon:yes gene_type:complete